MLAPCKRDVIRVHFFFKENHSNKLEMYLNLLCLGASLLDKINKYFTKYLTNS